MSNKLDNFGPVYLINLKRRPDRLANCIKNFEKYNVKGYTIIEAIDGSTEDLMQYVTRPHSIRNNELACTLSHLKTIKHWYETSDTQYAIIMEDDLSFETVEYWKFTWQEFINNIDFDYDLFQLSIINSGMDSSIHKWNTNDFGNGIYLVSRKLAEKVTKDLINLDGKYDLPDNPLADHFLYRNYDSYSAPLFTISLETQADVNPGHRNIHQEARDKTLEFWQNGGLTIN